MKVKSKGTLVLIPTPIDENTPLETVAFKLLEKACNQERDSSLFAIEDLKPGRRRWLRFGLPRDVVSDFILYNEHTMNESSYKLLEELKSGKNIYLMSDGGLPAFCDPGQLLVDLCHRNGIKVTATPFANSVILALALSGFVHEKFLFAGFPPRKKDERLGYLKKLLATEKKTIVLMDTPYRRKKLIEELVAISCKREIFLAMDLNCDTQELVRGTPKAVLKRMGEVKKEFVLVVCGLHY